MDPKLHLGLGKAQTATVEVIWPTGGMSRVENVTLNTPLVLKEEAKQGNELNFDFSKDRDDHIHRVGRTGRAGIKNCQAITLLTIDQKREAATLVKILEDSNQCIEKELESLA